jgi:hypothetical protein
MYWWGKHLLTGTLSLFFLLFGIDLLISTYHLKNPLEFIMGFFASNLIIMISAVGILHPLIKIFSRLRSKNVDEDNDNI